MKHLLKLTIFLSFIFTNCFAQELSFEIKSSEKFKEKFSKYPIDIDTIGSINNRHFLLFKNLPKFRNHYSITIIDDSLNVLNKKELNLIQPGINKEKKFEGILMINQKIALFTSFINDKNKKHYLFRQFINIETLEIEPEITLIGELDYSSYSKFERANLTFEVSPNKTKIMLFYTILNSNYEILNSRIYVYNNEFSLLWKNENVGFNYEGHLSYEKFKINNSGIVFLLGKHYVNKNDIYYVNFDFSYIAQFKNYARMFPIEKPTFNYQLYKMEDGNKNIDLYDLKLEGRFIRNLNFSFLDDSIICNGIYAEPGFISTSGTFVFKLNPYIGNIYDVFTQKFDKDLISQGFDKKELAHFKKNTGKMNEWDPYNYTISELKNKKNGEKYFTIEQFYDVTFSTRGGSTTLHLNRDIFVLTLNTNNSFKNVSKISKFQFNNDNPQLNSFYAFEQNNSLNFIFNATVKDNNIETYLVSLDANSKQNQTLLSEYKKNSTMIMPKSVIPLSDSSIIYPLRDLNWNYFNFQTIKFK